MSENKENIVRTTVRLDGDLHQALADFVYNQKKRKLKATIDGTFHDALRMYLSSMSSTGETEKTLKVGNAGDSVSDLDGEAIRRLKESDPDIWDLIEDRFNELKKEIEDSAARTGDKDRQKKRSA